jgi:muramoyltetrapeptide carboxypeptidase LdcA involved in peptidoglycan recycling
MLVRKGYLAGTDEQRAEDLNAMFVFLEDVGEAPYRIDRMLTQLLLTAGKLREAAGIVLGRFNDCEAENKVPTARRPCG